MSLFGKKLSDFLGKAFCESVVEWTDVVRDDACTDFMDRTLQ